MYYVTSIKNLRNELHQQLIYLFGKKARMDFIKDDAILIKVRCGFPTEERKLTQEELDAGVIGGGIVCGLDGKTFIIRIEEVQDGK